GPADVQPHVTTFGPAQLLQSSAERRHIRLCIRIVLAELRDHCDAPHRAGLLRAPSKRPRRRAAEQSDEFAAFDHSITSSARVSTVAGTSRPSALAVLRLIAISYLVGA